MSAQGLRPDEQITCADGQNACPDEQTITTDGKTDEALTPEQEAARKRRIRRLLALLMLFLALDLLIAGVLIGALRHHRRDNASVRDAQAKKLGVTQEMTEEERDELIAIALGEAHNYISLHSEMTVRDGVAELYLTNEAGSPCSVEVELVLLDSREVVLRTGVIEPGWYLKTSNLAMNLAPGEYYCLARCLFYTTDDNAYLGTTVRQVILTVL